MRLSLLIALLPLTVSVAPRERVEDLSSYFGAFKGTFVLEDPSGDTVRFHPEKAKVRVSPCSTFKVPHALIGLETGVLSGPEHPMKWDGKKREIATWNQDQTLRTAIKYSVVWYFQKVAEGVGLEREQAALRAMHYGNEDVSGGLTTFWLGTSLAISADEEADFMRRLAAGSLPFSQKNQATVRELIELRRTPRGVLHGKTGTSGGDGTPGPLGWFVGYVEHEGKAYPFATRIEGKGALGAKARKIAEQILEARQLL
jgi:bla regulator protein BlaR1